MMKKKRRQPQRQSMPRVGREAYFSEAKIILDSMGSTGNSAIFRPD
jgi:hypothetical protein